jgi:integrase
MTLEPWIEHDKRRGTYIVRWRDINKKKHRDTFLYPTKNDARERIKIVRRNIIDASLGKVDLTRSATACLKAYSEQCENRDMASKVQVACYIGLFLKNMSIGVMGDITRRKLIDYQNLMYKNKHPKGTIQKYMGTLRTWLRWCMSNGWLAINPFFDIKLESPRKIERFFTDDELRAIEDAIDNREFLCLFRLGYKCGLRPGEMRRVKKADILWNNATGTGELAIPADETKTEAGGRIVPLPQDVYELLIEIGDGVLNTWTQGRFDFYFNKVKTLAGIKDKVVKGRVIHKTIYWTRHTYSKRYLENGGSLRVLKDRLGHTSIVLTADTYGHMERSAIKDISVPDIHPKPSSCPAIALRK